MATTFLVVHYHDYEGYDVLGSLSTREEAQKCIRDFATRVSGTIEGEGGDYPKIHIANAPYPVYKRYNLGILEVPSGRIDIPGECETAYPVVSEDV